MHEIAELIHLAITDFENKQSEIIQRVEAICQKYPLYSNIN